MSTRMLRVAFGLVWALGAVSSALADQVAVDSSLPPGTRQPSACVHSHMPLFNQLGNYNIPVPATYSPPVVAMYPPNDHACAPVSSAMAVRALIEESSGRFASLDPSSAWHGLSRRLPNPVPSSVGATPPAKPDYWDVLLANHQLQLMQTGPNGTTSDNLKQGYTDRATLDFSNAVMPRKFDGSAYDDPGSCSVSYPTFQPNDLAAAISKGYVIVLSFVSYDSFVFNPTNSAYCGKPAGGNGTALPGSYLFLSPTTGHTVVINGFTRDSSGNVKFRVFDPYGGTIDYLSMQVYPDRIFVTGAVASLPRPVPGGVVLLSYNDGYNQILGNPSIKTSRPPRLVTDINAVQINSHAGMWCQ